MSGRILWRFVERRQLRAECGDLRAWLTTGEQRRLTTIGHPAKREASALACVALKQLMQAECSAELDRQSLELVSKDARGRSVRPRLILAGRLLPWSVSVSHTETALLVAVATRAGLTVGVDLVAEQGTDRQALHVWFDAAERELAAAGAPREALELWAVKEAVYKAANYDDRFAPRQVAIRRTADGRYQATYRGLDLASRCRIEMLTLPGHVAALAQVTSGRAAFAPVVEHELLALADSSQF